MKFFFIKFLKYFYRNYIPKYLKIRISFLIDPLPFNILRKTPSIRVENYFLIFKEETKKENNQKRNLQNLHKIFNKYLVRSHLIDNNWWSDLVILARLNDGPKFQKLNESLINRIESSNFDSLEYFEVLDIYSLCIRLSLFKLGFYIRQKSISIALNYDPLVKKKENWKLRAKLTALFEIGNFDEFDKLLSKFNNKDVKELYFLKYLRNFFDKHEFTSNDSTIIQLDSDEDLKFRGYLENKKISIVSPKLVNLLDGIKIDESDIVIRTNYEIGDSVHKGTRSDISYFNRETSIHIEKNGCPRWPSDVQWIVGRALNYLETILNKVSLDGNNIQNVNLRKIKRIDKLLYNGSLFMLPNIIIDLARYKPKEIFLYHFDLLLSKNRVAGYFVNVSNDQELHVKLVKNLSVHDPVINFNILKSFWKRGFIKGDNNFEEIMKMEIEDYMTKLQENYRIGNSLN